MNVTEAQPLTRTAQGGWQNAFHLSSSSSGQFQLEGGYYILSASATWGGGSVTLQIVGPDGSTLISTALTLTANGQVGGYLPPGTYQITVTTSTAVYAVVQSVPI
jgi:hypothetical protein